MIQYTAAQVLFAEDGADFDAVRAGEQVVGGAEDDFGGGDQADLLGPDFDAGDVDILPQQPGYHGFERLGLTLDPGRLVDGRLQFRFQPDAKPFGRFVEGCVFGSKEQG